MFSAVQTTLQIFKIHKLKISTFTCRNYFKWREMSDGINFYD